METEGNAANELKPAGIVAKVRKVVKIGSSFYISLPQEFIRKYHFKAGDKVGVLSDSIVKVIPMKEI